MLYVHKLNNCIGHFNFMTSFFSFFFPKCIAYCKCRPKRFSIAVFTCPILNDLMFSYPNYWMGLMLCIYFIFDIFQHQAIFLNVVSGVALTETAGDLAVAAAICSRYFIS